MSDVTTVSDATTEFFESLRDRGHEPLLGRANGTFRFELANGEKPERWLVAVDKGDITVSRAARKADCTIYADRALFNRIAAGEVNVWTAVLRGALAVEGDPELLVMFQRILPEPRER